ncbi:MAG: SAM-dependent chlorinase/fluorinase [Patescibacteria group bacterium]
MKKRIVFITDCVDIAYNELRGTVLSQLNKLGNNVELEIEPVVPVKPFSLINGSFVLRLMAEAYPEDTIFSVILNPLKERPVRLTGKTKTKRFYFLGANTGVFDWFLRDFGIEELYEIHDPGFFPFGGKYVHAPAATQIAFGGLLGLIGSKFDSGGLVKLDIPEGTILHIDDFGLIKFKSVLPKLNEGDRVTIEIVGNSFSAVYVKRMMSRETGEWVLYPGSSLGLPEIGKVRQDGASEINADIGDIVKIVL